MSTSPHTPHLAVRGSIQSSKSTDIYLSQCLLRVHTVLFGFLIVDRRHRHCISNSIAHSLVSHPCGKFRPCLSLGWLSLSKKSVLLVKARGNANVVEINARHMPVCVCDYIIEWTLSVKRARLHGGVYVQIFGSHLY